MGSPSCKGAPNRVMFRLTHQGALLIPGCLLRIDPHAQNRGVFINLRASQITSAFRLTLPSRVESFEIEQDTRSFVSFLHATMIPHPLKTRGCITVFCMRERRKHFDHPIYDSYSTARLR